MPISDNGEPLLDVRNLSVRYGAVVAVGNGALAVSGSGGGGPVIENVNTVGWLARSPYEWSHHVKIGLDFGVTEPDIQGLIDDRFLEVFVIVG